MGEPIRSLREHAEFPAGGAEEVFSASQCRRQSGGVGCQKAFT